MTKGMIHENLAGFGDIEAFHAANPPQTRFPDLDIYEHSLDRPLQRDTEGHHSFRVSCNSHVSLDSDKGIYKKIVLNQLKRYAHFVAGLTGLETVSLWCDITIASNTWSGNIVAGRSAHWDAPWQLSYVVMDIASLIISDFSYSFNSSRHEHSNLKAYSFRDLQIQDLEVEVILPTSGAPARCLLSQIEHCFKTSDIEPESRLDEELSILPNTSHHHQLESEAFPNRRSVHSMFESQAAEHPDRCAIEFLHPEFPRESPSRLTTLSYKELNQESENVANFIREKSHPIKHLSNQIVPVFISPSPELYIAYLAILKAGHAFCPLPVDAPSPRLLHIIRETRPSVILGVGSAPEDGPWHEMNRAFHTAWLDIRCCTPMLESLSPCPPSHDSLAYVMYTSGSSGKPKGVQITHRAVTSSIIAHLNQLENTMPQGIPVRWFQMAAPTFDPSILEIFVTLSIGGTLCATSREMALSAPEIAMTETRSTITMATPGIAAMFDVHRLPTLQCLWTMGETLTSRIIADFARLDPQSLVSTDSEFTRLKFCLCNAYGPTEAAINVTFFPRVPPHMRGSIIGFPLGQSQLLVIDSRAPDIKPVPLGFVGELVIAGEQLALGYINEPKESSYAFIDDKRYGRLYRTGDRARVVWDPQDAPVLEYLGRITDGQIKLNGQRVELGEIENVLCGTPDVKSAVALVRKSSQSGEPESLLLACFTPEPGADLSSEAIEENFKKIANSYLPSYMRPQKYLRFDQFPRSLAGKLDRREIARIADDISLRDQGPLERQQRNTRVYSVTAGLPSGLEAEASRLWTALHEALRKTSGGNHVISEYLQYQLDSLSAIRFLRNMREVGIKNLSLTDILHAQSLETLAQMIINQGQDQRKLVGLEAKGVPSQVTSRLCTFRDSWQTTVEEHFGLTAADIHDILPTTELQSRMLLSFSKSCRESTKQRKYVYHSLHTFRNAVDICRLRTIWSEIVQRHDIYRAVFMPVDDEMSAFAQIILNSSHEKAQAQFIHKRLEFPIEENVPEVVYDAAKTAEGLIALESATPILTLLETSKETTILLSMIHAIFDLGSLQLLVADITASLHDKKPAPREEIRTSVEAHFLPPTIDVENGYWDIHSSQQDLSPFPSLTPIRRESTLGSTSDFCVLSRLSMTEFESRSKNLLCSPLSVLQAAWATILFAYTSTDTQDVLFGTVLADRADSNKSICVGPLLTILPTRINPKKSSLNIEVLRCLSDHNSRSLLQLNSPVRNRRRNGHSYDSTIALQVFQEVDDVDDMLRDTVALPMAHDFAVMIEAAPNPNGQICYKATYTDIHLDQASAKMMLLQLDEILIWILTNPMLPYLQALSCVGPEKISTLNPDPITRSDIYLLHSKFEANAHAYPEYPALEFWYSLDGNAGSVHRWSYKDVELKAHALAESIVSRFGDMRNAVIPITMDKQPELYLAVLAVLKTGAGWSPIDINWPVKRRNALLGRLGAEIVLTAERPTMEMAALPDGVEVVMVSLESKETESVGNKDCRSTLLQPPESLAYLIWTSGTTGPPKGVEISHKAVRSSMDALQANISYKTRSGSRARCLQFAQQTFDVFVQDLFCTWDQGGTIISATKELITTSFSNLCCNSGATHVHLTPSFAATIKRDSCPTLETVTMIGEKLPQYVADDWGRDLKAYNTYGPAEAAVVATFNKFGEDRKFFKTSNIGRPLPSVSCNVIRDGQIIMTQGVGELALGGPQIADGYFKDDEKTMTKFVNFGNGQQRLYLTGDIVRLLADGSLEFIGREDDLVKLGGIRVELSEISYAIVHCHRLITQVETILLSREDRPSKTIVSFIAGDLEIDQRAGKDTVTDRQVQPVRTAEAVELARLALLETRQTLPSFMIPSSVIILRSIPRTSSAKVDHKALQKAYETLDLRSWEVLMWDDKLKMFDESSQTALILRQSLSEFSGAPLETIHAQNSLHALGIDSLSASRFGQSLKKLDITLSVAEILKCDTLGQVLQILQERGSNPHSHIKKNESLIAEFNKAWLPSLRLALNVDIGFVMPATSLQEGILSESMLAMSSYWSSHLFELRPTVDIRKLKIAWHDIATNTEALRTSFAMPAEITHINQVPSCESSFLMLVAKDVVLDWDEIDCTNCFENAAKERADHVAAKHQKTFFHQPPWAVTILNIGNASHMMLTIHHSIHDNESIDILMNGVATIHQGLKLPENPTITQALGRSTFNTGKEKDETYWCEILDGFSGFCSGPWPDISGTGRPTKWAEEPRTMLCAKRKLASSLEEFNRFVREFRTTYSVIFKVAFGCLLLDYLDSPKLVFGEVLSQRFINSEFHDVIAPLLEMKPVPFVFRKTALDIVSEQTELNSQSWSYNSLSGPLMRKLLGRFRNEPLYSALFAFHPGKENSRDEEALQSKLWQQKEDAVQFKISVEHDFALNVYLQEDLTIELAGKVGIIDQEGLNMFCLQVETFIQAILRDPARPLQGLLDQAGRAILSISEARSEKSEDDPSYIKPTYWLEYYAQSHPEWIAVEVAASISHGKFETRKWDFITLYKNACKIARFLKEQVGDGSVIALCTGRTLVSYAAIAGIFMSGNVYLPIDDRLPPRRKVLLIEDSECSALMVDDGTRFEYLDISLRQCLVFNIDELSLAEEVYGVPDSQIIAPEPDEVAYLIYTSGSTGKPKGVKISHRSLCGFVEGLTGYMNHHSSLAGSQAGIGKWLGLASRAFDVHLAEIFLAWRSGLATITGPRELLLDDLRLVITELRVTHACFVPSLLEQAELQPDQIPHFVFMTIGGEKLSKRIVETWSGHPRITAVNAYGPTELAIGCTAAHIVPAMNPGQIGTPYGNTVAHILIPETFHYAKKGQTGELCFTGCLVGNGYHQRPEATGFVENFRGQRMYRTGDIARMHPDGSLTYLGRSDDQTKVRGQRMELSEISESILSSNTETSIEVATLLTDHSELSSTFLTSFVSRSVEREKRYDAKLDLVDDNGLRAIAVQSKRHCREILPVFMVPDYVVPLNIIPLAKISGKVDRKSLKSFFASLSVSQLLEASGDESDTLIETHRKLELPEQKIAASIHKFLKLGPDVKIGPQTALFKLGLDSINAVGLILRLREIGFNCTLRSLLANATIESLAVGGDWSSDSGPCMNSSIPLEKLNIPKELMFDQTQCQVSIDSVDKVLPCLPMQESTMTATLMGQSPIPYINHVVLKLDRGVDLTRLRQAWHDLIVARPILRSAFIYLNENLVQLVLRPEATGVFPWKCTRYEREGVAADFIAKISKITEEEIVNEIQKLPPLRLNVLRSEKSSTQLILSIHHALYDGKSFDMMMEDLFLRYSGEPLQNRGTLEQILHYRASQEVAIQRKFWQNYLQGYCQTKLSYGGITRNQPVERADKVFYDDLSSIRNLANRLGVTLSTLTQHLFAVTYARRLRRTDVLFGVILSGRSIPIQDPECIAAPCITTIPQRLQIGSHDSLLDSLFRTQATAAECMEHQHTSLRDISRWTQLPLPMFHALFSFNYEESEEKANQYWAQRTNSMHLDYPLAIEFLANRTLNLLTVTYIGATILGGDLESGNFIEEMKIVLSMIVKNENPRLANLGSFEQIHDLHVEDERWDEDQWSEIEIKLKEVIQDFKGLESDFITKNVSFFQLGIDSISSIRLAKSMQKVGFVVGPTDIMHYPSIGDLGQFLSKRSVPALKAAKLAHTDRDSFLSNLAVGQGHMAMESIEALYECTPLQAGMIVSTLTSGGEAYVHRHVHILPRNIKIDRLRKAWAQTIQLLDILRTSFFFTPKDQRWIACVDRRGPGLDLDFTPSSPVTKLRPAIHLLVEDDFKKPPFHAAMIHEEEQYLFQLTLHHALYDGFSLPMVFEVFSRAYEEGLESNIAPRYPFYEIANIIHQSESSSNEYWFEKLKDYRRVGMHKIDLATTQSRSSRVCKITSVEALRQSKLLGVTLQSILLTAYAKLLATKLHKRDVVFGHVIAGRSVPDVDCERIIGPLFNTVPLRVRFDNLLFSNQDVTKQVLSYTIEAQVHQHASLAEIQNKWRQADAHNEWRLFDSLFLFQNYTSTLQDNLWCQLETEQPPSTSEYCLSFEVEQKLPKLMLSASCHIGCLVCGNLDGLFNEYEEILENMLYSPMEKIATFPRNLSNLPLVEEKIKLQQSLGSGGNEDNEVITVVKDVLSQACGIPLDAITNSRNIFSLGLTSLSAMNVAAECRKRGLDLSVANVLQGVTVSGIYSQITKKNEANKLSMDFAKHLKFSVLLQPLVREESIDAIFPALSGQTYHLAAWLNSGKRMYMPTWAYACIHLDVERFLTAWIQLRNRHAILRSTFAALNSTEAVQIILKEEFITNDCFTLGSGLVDDKSVQKYVKEEQSRATDMETPPIRMRVVQGSSRDVMLLTIHHALYDAWSLPIILADLKNLYHGLKLQPSPDWLHYVRYSTLEHRSLNESEFWTKVLKSAERTILGGESIDSTNRGLDTRKEHTFISIQEPMINVTNLSQTCHKFNISVPAALILCFARSLATTANVSNPVFGFFSLGRLSSFSNVSRIAGPCLNILPLTVNSPWEEPWYLKGQEVQQQLAARVPYEQSFLPDIRRQCAQKGLQKSLEFNTFLNILWSETSSARYEEDEKRDDIFHPIGIGVPSDYVPERSFGGNSGIEGLRWPSTHDAIYVDISLSEDRASVRIGARIEGQNIELEKAMSLLRRIETAAKEFVQPG